LIDYRKKRVLVTGASSGIGRALVIELSKAGAHCLALARRGDKLAELQAEVAAAGHTAPQVIIADLLTDRGFGAAVAALDEADILINNAGVGMNGRFLDASQSDLARVFELNFHVPVQLCREASLRMRPKRAGGILNVASIAGIVATPFHGAYSATKAGLLNFSEGLHSELLSDNIHVTALCPGVTETEFFDAGGYSTESFVYRLPRKSPESVARAGLKALSKNKIAVVPGIQTKLLVALTKVLPSSFVTSAAGHAMSTD
jgi:short-subunit dehydrogenase